MEPKDYAFRRWFFTSQLLSENLTGCLGSWISPRKGDFASAKVMSFQTSDCDSFGGLVASLTETPEMHRGGFSIYKISFKGSLQGKHQWYFLVASVESFCSQFWKGDVNVAGDAAHCRRRKWVWGTEIRFPGRAMHSFEKMRASETTITF